MAIYHLNTRVGKTGNAFKHFKKNYDSEEALYKKNFFFENVPYLLFWKLADENEPVNGRVYREIELSLPYEFSLEDNIKLVNEYIDSILMGKHYYSVVIKKNKPESKNIYALIMFSEKLINKDILPEKFFKRYCYRNPSNGGAKKETLWNKKEILFKIRKIWEDTLNKYLKNKNIELVKRKE